MFRRRHPPPSAVTIFLDGEPIAAAPGDSVAAALLGAGVDRFRTTPVNAVPRAPYCMIGVCFDCLMEIDGMPHRQACLVTVAEGMRVRRQAGDGSAGEI